MPASAVLALIRLAPVGGEPGNEIQSPVAGRGPRRPADAVVLNMLVVPDVPALRRGAAGHRRCGRAATGAGAGAGKDGVSCCGCSTTDDHQQ